MSCQYLFTSSQKCSGYNINQKTLYKCHTHSRSQVDNFIYPDVILFTGDVYIHPSVPKTLRKRFYNNAVFGFSGQVSKDFGFRELKIHSKCTYKAKSCCLVVITKDPNFQVPEMKNPRDALRHLANIGNFRCLNVTSGENTYLLTI